jgi:molybdenum cofactor biosynthesis enzyme MoaA
LRISVTDRCQFRCTCCMPREVFGRDFAFLPREDLLTFQELTLSSSVTQPFCRSCTRTDRYSDLRTRATGRTRKVEMSHLGG